MGNSTLRSLLVLGAMSVLRRAKNAEVAPRWIAGLLARRPAKVVAVAMANKAARIAYALLTKGEAYRTSPVSAA
jgi:transposase